MRRMTFEEVSTERAAADAPSFQSLHHRRLGDVGEEELAAVAARDLAGGFITPPADGDEEREQDYV